MQIGSLLPRHPRDTQPQPTHNPPTVLSDYHVEMKTEIQNMQLSVQKTVDELFGEHMIPFELTAYKLCAGGFGEYIVPFHDSRLHSIRFHWRGYGSFREVVRTAVLDHVEKMTGPAVVDWVNLVALPDSQRLKAQIPSSNN